MKSWIIALCLNACFCFSACAEQTVRITSGADPYVIALLNHTLSYQNEVHTLDFVKNIPTQNRAIRLLGAENGIDVFWSVTSDEREKQALAVRIPIVKGVLGYRLGVIKKSRLEFFTKLRSDGELKKLIIESKILLEKLDTSYQSDQENYIHSLLLQCAIPF